MIGEGVEYIFSNSHHTNQLPGVTPKDLIEEGGEFDYDKEKYRDMLWERLKPCWDISVLIGQYMETLQRKIRSGGMALETAEFKT